jgi:glucosamine-6-phosphate deaminase
MRLIIQPNRELVGIWTANYVIKRILEAKPTVDNPFVLGLPTGTSPLGMYKYLIEANRSGIISFRNVVTFNMDEYVGLPKEHPQSFHYFMWENFFRHIDIISENINILNGTTNNLISECSAYEEKIKSYGGINLFIGGVGEDGHIAFNEPGSSLNSRTRVKTLTTNTIQANSRFFENDLQKVPHQALTVGVRTVMEAEEVLIIAFGRNKARAIRHAIEEPISHLWTISGLQMHPKTILIVDEEACNELKYGTVKYFVDVERNNSSSSYF